MELIRLLRLEGELNKVRMARQKMSELFPLTEGNGAGRIVEVKDVKESQLFLISSLS